MVRRSPLPSARRRDTMPKSSCSRSCGAEFAQSSATKGALGPTAVAVNRAREHRATGAALAIEQDWATARRDTRQHVDDLPHRRRRSEYAGGLHGSEIVRAAARRQDRLGPVRSRLPRRDPMGPAASAGCRRRRPGRPRASSPADWIDHPDEHRLRTLRADGPRDGTTPGPVQSSGAASTGARATRTAPGWHPKPSAPSARDRPARRPCASVRRWSAHPEHRGSEDRSAHWPQGLDLVGNAHSLFSLR